MNSSEQFRDQMEKFQAAYKKFCYNEVMSEKFGSWPTNESEASAFDKIRNSLLSRFAAGTIALAGCDAPPKELPPEKPITQLDSTEEFVEAYMPSYSKFHIDGEMTPEEIRGKTIHLADDVSIIDDTGVYFYVVTKSDKTIEEIKDKLLRYPEFAHLKDQHGLKSFNIRSRHLKPGMKIPIPQMNSEREISDEQFRLDAHTALKQILKNDDYGATIKHILEKPGMTEEKLIKSLLAIAKQESGGAQIGQFEFHRYEGDNGHSEMSLGYGHVLMQGSGLKARKTLGMTEGQTFNITNATKLIFGFLVEKSKDDPTDLWDFFPFTEKNLEDFASFYNGKNWRSTNPDYAKNVWQYYKSARD